MHDYIIKRRARARTIIPYIMIILYEYTLHIVYFQLNYAFMLYNITTQYYDIEYCFIIEQRGV